jgi:hypothetical protein
MASATDGSGHPARSGIARQPLPDRRYRTLWGRVEIVDDDWPRRARKRIWATVVPQISR